MYALRCRIRTLFAGILCVGTLAAALLIPAVPAAAQGSAAADSRTEVLRSVGDGFPIHITYYPAIKEKSPRGVQEASVIILLPGEGGSRLIYDKTSAPPNGDPLAVFLQNQGHAVISVDPRKHGESVLADVPAAIHPDDYAKMVFGDLAAVKNFIFEEHQAKRLNMSKLGLLAADETTPVALAFAEADWLVRPYDDSPVPANRTPRGQDVRALVLLSPTTSSGRLIATKSMSFLRELGLAFLIFVGTQDPVDKGQAASMHRVVSKNKQNELATLERANTKARGADLLANPAVRPEMKIKDFFDKHLKELDIPWRDRRSRLDRE